MRQGSPLVVIFFAMSLLLQSCSSAPGSHAGRAGPVIDFFRASPASVERGESVELSWGVRNADSLFLGSDAGATVEVTGESSVTLAPEEDVTYLLSARGAGQVAERSLTVSVTDPGGDADPDPEPDPAPDPEPQPDPEPEPEPDPEPEPEPEPEPKGAPTIDSFRSAAGAVNPGVAATLTWEVGGAETLRLLGPGLEEGGVDVSGRSSLEVVPPAGASYTLQAANRHGQVEESFTAGREIPAAGFLIAGQSNAQGRGLPRSAAPAADEGVAMLGNDYRWKPAYEPLDDCTGQLDQVSADYSGSSCTDMGNSGVSLGVSLGNEIAAVTGGEVFLIPAAKGGTETSEWRPAADRYDRSTLFGSATHRGSLAGPERGAPLDYERSGRRYGAIIWYQGEADTSSLTEAGGFITRSDRIFDAFEAELGAPIIFAQLARYAERDYEVGRNLLFQEVRESQRRMESGAREPSGSQSPVAEPRRHMVVTHDLPMSDRVHLSAAGEIELGRRVALAVRQHLLGESVDGTGPRLEAVRQSGERTVEVDIDRPVTAPRAQDASAYSGYFTVYLDERQLPIERVERSPADASVVLITLAEPVTGAVAVRYMPPEGRIYEVVEDVIRSAECGEPMPGTSLCLPLPAFGASPAPASLQSLQFGEDDLF